jgi:hypothetical protein
VIVAIRRARDDDVDFLVELVTHEDVEPFLAAIRAKDRGSTGRDQRSKPIPRRSASASRSTGSRGHDASTRNRRADR